MVLVVSVVAGCAGGNDGGAGHEARKDRGPLVTGTPAVPSVTRAPTIKALTLPIFAYAATGAERAAVSNAITELARRCASRFGFTLDRGRASPMPFNKLQMRRMWGVMTMEDAKDDGYHVPGELGGGGPSHGSQAEREMSDAELLVLYGSVRPLPPNAIPTASPGSHNGKAIPAGGCFGEANRKLGAAGFDPNKLTDPILVGMFKRTKNDPRVLAVFQEWSACMAESGYDYGTPSDANGDPRWGDLIGGAPSSVEIETAIADVRCKKSTNLIGVTFSVNSAYQEAAIEKKLPHLTQHRSEWGAIVRKAATTLGIPVPE